MVPESPAPPSRHVSIGIHDWVLKIHILKSLLLLKKGWGWDVGGSERGVVVCCLEESLGKSSTKSHGNTRAGLDSAGRASRCADARTVRFLHVAVGRAHQPHVIGSTLIVALAGPVIGNEGAEALQLGSVQALGIVCIGRIVVGAIAHAVALHDIANAGDASHRNAGICLGGDHG